MATIQFNEFYTKIKPFAFQVVEEVSDIASFDIIKTNFPNAAKLTFRSLQLSVRATAMEIASLIFPSLEQTEQKLILRSLDCMIGTRQIGIRPSIMACKLPETLRSKEYADYARSLSLPHIALVIDAAVRPTTVHKAGGNNALNS